MNIYQYILHEIIERHDRAIVVFFHELHRILNKSCSHRLMMVGHIFDRNDVDIKHIVEFICENYDEEHNLNRITLKVTATRSDRCVLIE